MKRFLFALAGVLAFLGRPAAAHARVEADPNKEYPITPEAGPYVICVKAYIGGSAHEMANRLTLHLRQNNWPAYVFDYTAEERRVAKEWLDARYANVPPDLRPHKTIRVEEQWGVLIGGYRDFDSASSDIANVKKTKEPPTKDVDFVDVETRQAFQLSAYAQCIATRNPMVRVQKTDPSAADPAWKRLNDGRPYNLLTKCGKPWTLAVAQFQGRGVIQPRSASSKLLDVIGLGGKSGDVLEASAAQAEEVARYLKENMHLETYVLHTRTGSVVTVGGYESPDDPGMKQMVNRLSVEDPVTHKRTGLEFRGTNIRLFDQPMPMKVPQL